MLGTHRRSRHQSPSLDSINSSGYTTDWCREEGKKAALEFKERMRLYREGHVEVTEAQCIREFAISLTEILSSTSLVAEDTGACRSLSPIATATSVSSKSKHWWKIFKRGKSLHRKDYARKDISLDNDPNILLDGILTQMNLQNLKETPTWERCRLLLIDRHGNHQLEVYTPPKNSILKMSLFCFLIEEVRPASLLEVPDSNSSFVIKSRSHGEYVFNADSADERDMWMSTISQYSTAHIPVSTSLNALSESQKSNRRFFPRSRSQTPIPHTATRTRRLSSHEPGGEDEPVMVDIVLFDDSHESIVRNTSCRAKSLCLDTPSPVTSDSSPLSSDHNSLPIQSYSTGQSPIRTLDSNAELINDDTEKPISSIGHSVATPPSPPIIPRLRKSSAPPGVIHSMQNGEETATPLFSSSEALGCVSSDDRLAFVTTPIDGRGHSRHRSYDSSYSHSTDIGGTTSPLVRNSYRIDLGSNERISNVTSGPSSTFSSAGNLHDVTRDVTHSPSILPTTPDTLVSLETSSQLSNPLYIETTSHIDIHLPNHTEHPYQSWATTSTDVENLRTLTQFPWFHGMISRRNATQLVLSGGGSGQYLVRQSESREGDFVLTFNSHNRAKHLRLTLDSTGCNIQHLWFEDARTMIDYFKTRPIPLDTTLAADDVTLTTYVNRSASDSFRTTTVINMERINRTPPRRSRSIHVSSSLGTSLDGSNSPIHGNRSGRQGSRWIFNRHQRSSSSQSVRSHATVQRTHSANAGSLQEIGSRGGGRWSNRVSENNYVSRHY